MSDWDASDDETPVAPVATKAPAKVAAPAVVVPSRNRKFAGEDEEEEDEEDDWDVSDSEKKKPAAAAAPVAAPKKKGTLKQKLAEKEAAKALGGGDELMDDETPQERRRREMAAAKEADAENAADLLGGVGINDFDINTVLKAKPKDKADLVTLAQQISTLLFDRLAAHPQYAHFATEICRMAVQPCRDVDVRKTATALGVIANEKVQEAKDKASGKKKGGKAKPALGLNKADVTAKADTNAYDEALDDDLDFM